MIFLIALFWTLCVIAALVMLCIPRLRVGSAYLMLCPTFGILGAFLGLSGLMMISAAIIKAFGLIGLKWLAIVAWIIGLVGGGIFGIVLGSLISDRVNAKLGWH